MPDPEFLPIDVSQALRDAENALRDFIAAELSRSLGSDWESRCGVSAERLAKWKERKKVEGRRQVTGVVDERLIYYADFYDLKTILNKNWDNVFAAALGEWKTLEVYLSELEKLRDPDAHRRDLLPHQRQLISGISGEIRTRIVRYRSKRETSDDIFPRIESARDSLGNMWVPGNVAGGSNVFTEMTLRVGDGIDFIVTARDPEDAPLEYCVIVGRSKRSPWQTSSAFSVQLTPEHISKLCTVELYVRSNKPYHAFDWFDDLVVFHYVVLPR
jgi:hypothetical protein